MATREECKAVKERHSARLLKEAGVVGVGVEKREGGDYVLTVHLDAASQEAESRLPTELDGCPVEIVRSGPFTKFQGQGQ
jgi:hypothetical protein